MVYVCIAIDTEKDLHKNSYENLKHINNFIKLAEKHNIKPTFFVTGECIKDNTAFFKALIKKYEVSSHSFNHGRLDALSVEKREEEIKKAFNDFKKRLGVKPIGFRAPQFSITQEDLKLINNAGFKYDSSIMSNSLLEIIFFPGFLKTSLKQIFVNSAPHKMNNLWTFPASALGLPFSAFTLRLFPLFILKLIFKLLSIKNKLIIFTMHSWDFMELKNSFTYSLCPLDKFIKKFEALIVYLKSQNSFINLSEYLRNLENENSNIMSV
jgi:peptidoglycan/xylan/chitin deacetylase (PgdA/CDA1 family)